MPGGKVSIGSFPLVYPIPVVLVGAKVGGAPNFETVGNCAIAGFNPGLVFVSSVRSHYTNRGIVENGTFSVNIPATDLVAVTDFCGIASGRDYDKGGLFKVFYGSLATAPMIEECPVNLECRVLHEYTYGEMQMFIGLIAQTYVPEEHTRWIADPRPGAAAGAGRYVYSRPALAELDPIIFHHDNLYYGIGQGQVVGHGYRDGKGVDAERLRR